MFMPGFRVEGLIRARGLPPSNRRLRRRELRPHDRGSLKWSLALFDKVAVSVTDETKERTGKRMNKMTLVSGGGK